MVMEKVLTLVVMQVRIIFCICSFSLIPVWTNRIFIQYIEIWLLYHALDKHLSTRSSFPSSWSSALEEEGKETGSEWIWAKSLAGKNPRAQEETTQD